MNKKEILKAVKDYMIFEEETSLSYPFNKKWDDLTITEKDAICWVDSHNNLRSKQTHHDGTNYTLYREVKPEISSDQLDKFCWKLYSGKATSKDITKYTRAIGKQVRNVYGW